MDYVEQRRDWYAKKAERQKKEIATIKPRTFLVDLSDADVDRLAWHAAKAGMTMAELLASFIGDLTEGTYSNGSDERECADAWYNRCGFSYFASNDVARLAQNNSLDTVFNGWNDYQTALAELEYTKKDFEDPEEEDITEEDVQDAEKWVAECRQTLEEALKDAKCEGTLEEVVAEVMAWYENANAAKGANVNLNVYMY